MELIYLYIEDIGRNIYDQYISFSDEYDVVYLKEGRQFKINKKSLSQNGMYGTNIIGIDLLVGRNGAGKTTILDLLGMDERERYEEYPHIKRLDKSGNEIYYTWFAIYHVRENLFAIEGYNPNALKCLSCLYDKVYGVVIEYDFDKNEVLKNGRISPLYSHISGRKRLKTLFRLGYVLYRTRVSNGWFNERSYLNEFSSKFFSRIQITDAVKTEAVFEYLLKSMHDESFKNEIETIPRKVTLDIKLHNRYGVWDFSKKKKEFSKFIYGNETSIIDVLPPDIATAFKKRNVFTSRQNMVIRYLEYLLLVTYDQNPDFRDESMVSQAYVEAEGTDVEKYNARKDYLIKLCEELCELRKENPLSAKLVIEEQDIHYIKTICEAIESIDEKYFLNYDRIKIPIEDYNAKKECINKLLRTLDESNSDYEEHLNHASFIRTSFENLSSGESTYINLYASLKTGIEKLNVKGTCLLLLDEPDAFFHPEWSRRFIDSLTRTLSKPPFKKIKYQIIITTHSPILLADVPVDHIHCLCKDKRNAIEIKEAKHGFLSSINTILVDTMFVSSSFGSFAERYVNNLLKRIQNIEIRVENNDDYGEIINEVHSLENDIDRIDEIMIRRKLNEMMMDIRKALYDKHKNNNSRIGELMKEIRRLELEAYNE